MQECCRLAIGILEQSCRMTSRSARIIPDTCTDLSVKREVAHSDFTGKFQIDRRALGYYKSIEEHVLFTVSCVYDLGCLEENHVWGPHCQIR